ncbi:hypothetical protein B7R78_0003345 [Ralstonia solanacearum]|uniref:hypothetical protein n=1 Tax=Ralstonia solanacearum species complex TaxID=3116862 RepID=UPI00025013BB|nr:hypothetical protein [Ralstonia solanacearum]MBT1536212.1 hypothetical protein [Ralstonia solanacearum]QOK81045.1 hypothetical protein HF906_02000 [Ralstonia solanacearum]CCF97991.1 hypothetical protein RSK60_350009 [Ralstonia solanacearum K60]
MIKSLIRRKPVVVPFVGQSFRDLKRKSLCCNTYQTHGLTAELKNPTCKRSSLQLVGTAIDHVDNGTLPGHRQDRRDQRKEAGVDVFSD